LRCFALSRAGGVRVSGVVARTLSPVMSARLLRAAEEEHGLGRVIRRTFDRLKAGYLRRLDVALASRGIIYTAWIVVGLLAFAMFMFSPKELAPSEDQGVIFGVLNTPSNSTLDQVMQQTRAVNTEITSFPEAGFTFQITLPNGGFWGVGLKPWHERKCSD